MEPWLMLLLLRLLVGKGSRRGCGAMADVVIKVVGLVKAAEKGLEPWLMLLLLRLLVWCRGSRGWRVWSHG